MTARIVTVPHLGYYYVGAKPIARLFGDAVIVPPKMTKRTLEIGSKYSPDSVCVPFKYTLGNFIEALEMGANVLVMLSGGCRMSFYGETQKVILQKLGYQFEFVKLLNDINVFRLMRQFKQLNPQWSYLHIMKMVYLSYLKIAAIDEIEMYIRKNIGFETQRGSFEGLFQQFLTDLDEANTLKDVREIREHYWTAFHALPVEKPAHPIRVGMVGEIYNMMEPFSNFFIETELARFGVEVHRLMNVTEVVHYGLNYEKYINRQIRDAQPYLHYAVGAHGTEGVATAHNFAKQGFDGLIHVKPFGCMPEINAIPALHNISRDFKIPILYFSFDSLTSETGVKTRLEAFYDMLVMKGAGHEHA